LGFLDDILDKVGEPYSGGKGFEYGTHEVVIGSAELTKKDTKTQKDATIINVAVFDEQDNDRTATCTLWFHSEGGAKMGVTKILGILVHNVAEEKKDAVRELGKKLFGTCGTPEESAKVAIKLITDKLVGKKAYLVAEPNGKYKTTSYGDLWHYPAEPQGEKQPTVDTTNAPGVDPSEIPDFGDDL
jgi:hypothetical protein